MLLQFSKTLHWFSFEAKLSLSLICRQCALLEPPSQDGQNTGESSSPTDYQWLRRVMDTHILSLQLPYVPDHSDSQSERAASAADRLVQEVRQEACLTFNTCLMI